MQYNRLNIYNLTKHIGTLIQLNNIDIPQFINLDLVDVQELVSNISTVPFIWGPNYPKQSEVNFFTFLPRWEVIITSQEGC